MFKSTIVADSINQHGDRLTTFVVTFPRYLLAEFNTHRMFSRNSASSRAIPFEKLLRSVEKNPFIPIAFQKEHSGMQGNVYWTETELIQEALDKHTPAIEYFTKKWLEARDAVLIPACHMVNNKLTKQIVNRLLEPFMYHTAIITATDFENFFAQRVHPATEIHFQKIATMMLEDYNKSTPVKLNSLDWHIPFGDRMDESKLLEIVKKEWGDGFTSTEEELLLLKLKVAIARCARVSYTVVGEEGKEYDYEKDIDLFNRLKASGHFSPFEHVAKVMTPAQLISNKYPHGYCGNFRGFIQYRKTLVGENKKDTRVNKK